jgi:uncharacterized protein DUF3800
LIVAHKILLSLVSGLPPFKRKGRLLGMWQAYVDDSGRLDHSPVLVLGGFVAPVIAWVPFNREWQRMLDMNPRIEYFKMNEAARLSDQFSHWSAERRDERVSIAYRIIEDHVTLQISTVIALEPFYRLLKKTSREHNKKGMYIVKGNPYLLAFSAIVHHVANHQRSLGVSEKIDFIFDDQAMEKTLIRDSWDELKERADPTINVLMGRTPQFEDDKEFLPLQAGDLLAWWVRSMATESINGMRPKIAPPWIPKRRIPGVQIVFDEPRLKDAIERASERTGFKIFLDGC